MARLTQRFSSPGFNLVEAAIVLGVVGLVIGGIWVAAASVSEAIKTTQMAAGINYFIDKAIAIYDKNTAGLTGGGTSTPAPLAMFEPLPAGFTSDGITPFGTSYSLVTFKSGSVGTAGATFIVWTRFPNAASCTKGIVEIGRNIRLSSIWDQASTYLTTFPVPFASASSFCVTGYKNIEVRVAVY